MSIINEEYEFEKINEDFLVLLLRGENGIYQKNFPIKEHFKEEKEKLRTLLWKEGDNIEEVITYLYTLEPMLGDRSYSYAKKLDKAYSTVRVSIPIQIHILREKRKEIYEAEKRIEKELIEKARGTNTFYKSEYSAVKEIEEYKRDLSNTIDLWFKAFDFDFSYNEAKKVHNNLIVGSHRLGGFSHIPQDWRESWRHIVYQVTENLKLIIRTNFGYGEASYFNIVLNYKGIDITPFSDWVEYRIVNASEVLRYTRNYRKRSYMEIGDEILLERGCIIKNEYWFEALYFIQEAANISLKNETLFVEKYILSECEKLINGINRFYNKSEFYLTSVLDGVYKFKPNESKWTLRDEEWRAITINDKKRKKYNVKGFELIGFKAEKIIGALEFLDKIREYKSILPVINIDKRILAMCEKFMPYIYDTKKSEMEELRKAEESYENFLEKHKAIRGFPAVEESLRKQIRERGWNFAEVMKNTKKENPPFYEKYMKAKKLWAKFVEKEKPYKRKIKLHRGNVETMNGFIEKYKKYA